MDPTRFLGLDLSTQSLTAVLIDSSGEKMEQFSINFDKTYPTYGTDGGVVTGKDSTVVHADPRMWLAALDDMLARLHAEGFTPHIRSVGVSAQQHGTVYLNADAAFRIAHLNAAEPPVPQLDGIFSRPTAPVWMDSSTHTECLEITRALGGHRKVAAITGSIATERFAGPQIRKFYKQDPAAYMRTAHIALVSSFVTSMLTGSLAPLDAGDGFGTNLADIATGRWHPAALDATAPELCDRLPVLETRDRVIGPVSPYLTERYGFSRQAKVIIGSGDNPCSLAGIGLIGDAGKKGISLGTSDTCFGYLSEPASTERSEGHIFGTADGRYMALLCFKNGSLARERMRNRFSLSWQDFSDILMLMPPGNNGKVMLPFFSPEITPLVLEPKVRRFGGLTESDARGNIGAVAEAQIASMYIHSAWMGPRPKVVLVTAGGSENRGLLRIISNIFDAQVRSFEVKDSAALGAAIRAAHAVLNRGNSRISWHDLTERFVEGKTDETVYPEPAAVSAYRGNDGFLRRYAVLESRAFGKDGNPEDRPLSA